MSTEQVTLFLAVLAVIAELSVAAAVVLSVGGRFSPTMARWRTAAAESVGPQALALALAVALVATQGSLYFSEIANFTPCRLCWYQRIAMYPLVPILGIAAFRRDLAVRPYVATVALIGASISTYHVLLERFPSLETGACEVDNPCTLIWVRRFGYLTIPTMALSAFALIATLVLVARHPVDELPEGDD